MITVISQNTFRTNADGTLVLTVQMVSDAALATLPANGADVPALPSDCTFAPDSKLEIPSTGEKYSYDGTQWCAVNVFGSAAGSGAPTKVTLASQMTDPSTNYLYLGSEEGYTAGHWYYNIGGSWLDGGVFGGTNIDNTLTQTGQAADAKATGDALALKWNIADTDSAPTENSTKLITSGAVFTSEAAIKGDLIAISGNTPIHMTEGYYINLSGTTADVNNPSAQGGTPTRYAVLSCSEGDVFTVNAQGGVSPRAYGFVDVNGNILISANASATIDNVVVTAPEDAAYFVVNDVSFTRQSYVGRLVRMSIDGLNNSVDYLDGAAVQARSRLTNSDDLDNIKTPGAYIFLSTSIPSNVPTGVNGAGTLVVMRNNAASTYYGYLQLLYTASASYHRICGTTGVWSNWKWVEDDSLVSRSILTSADDLDDIVTIGIYGCRSSSLPAKVPGTEGGTLIVFTNPSGAILQTYYTAKMKYHRVKSGSTWYGWVTGNGTMTELPVLELTGDTTNMSKDNAVSLAYSLFGATGTCTCKWQGSSSLRYAKKNYTINLDSAMNAMSNFVSYINTRRTANGNISTLPANTRWGDHTKYCFKANYVDPSMMRNIVCARLWAQIVGGRVTEGEVTDGRSTSPCYGAIDGFPVEIKINGESVGLYTMNIPKDAWMFDMGTANTEYLISGEDNSSNSTKWKALAELDGDDFSVEYSADGVSDDTIKTSLNAAIQAAIDAGSDWETTLAPYVDIDSVFDYFIFTCCVNNHDALARNILYGTYDGTKWFMSAYDMDTTFGVDPYGTSWFDVVNDRNQFAEAATMHQLAYLMYTHSKSKLKARYQELRSTVLSDANVWKELSNFAVLIPQRDLLIDREIWQSMPGTYTANMAQYMDYYKMHCAYLDSEIAAM